MGWVSGDEGDEALAGVETEEFSVVMGGEAGRLA